MEHLLTEINRPRLCPAFIALMIVGNYAFDVPIFLSGIAGRWPA
jgi:hypothetical protein